MSLLNLEKILIRNTAGTLGNRCQTDKYCILAIAKPPD
jgi:hypothetical protein